MKQIAKVFQCLMKRCVVKMIKNSTAAPLHLLCRLHLLPEIVSVAAWEYLWEHSEMCSHTKTIELHCLPIGGDSVTGALEVEVAIAQESHSLRLRTGARKRDAIRQTAMILRRWSLICLA